MIILEAEGFHSVVVGNLCVESPSGLADEENRPHLHVGSLVGHGFHQGGAQQIETDGGEGLCVWVDPFLGQVAHPLSAEDGSLASVVVCVDRESRV